MAAVRMGDAVEQDDGSLALTIVISKTVATKLRKQDDWQARFTAACRAALRTTRDDSVRISAYVPKGLRDDLAAYCVEKEVKISQFMGGRVLKYVNENGDRTLAKYPRLALVPEYTPRKKDDKKSTLIQVFATKEQAAGFKEFCKANGTNRNAFFKREIILHLNRYEAAKKARAEKKADGAPLPPDDAPGPDA